MEEEKDKTGPYESAVQFVTEKVKPHLRHSTDKFVRKSIESYAKDNPRFAKMIEFEVVRRGNGAGLTQDVAEPLIWIGVKSAAALAIQIVAESFKNNKIKLIGRVSAFTVLANQAVDLFRLMPRYKAGLQGSLEMAKERWWATQATGVDPFSNQTAQLAALPESLPTEDTAKKAFMQRVEKSSLAPSDILDNKNSEAISSRN